MKPIIALCCMFAIGCTHHKDIDSLKSSLRISGEMLSAKQDESLGILRENTTALAVIKDQIDTLKASQTDSETGNGKECDLESDPPQDTATDANESQGSSPGSQPVAVSAVELFVTSTESCTPCRHLWRDVDAGKFEGFDVQKSEDFTGIVSYPAIRYRAKHSPTGWMVRYGYDSDQLAWLKSNLLTPETMVTRTAVPMSRGDMIMLHNSLHGGGAWRWQGDLATHLQTTHGVVLGGEPVSGSFFPVQGYHSFLSARSVVRPVSRGANYSWRARVTTR